MRESGDQEVGVPIHLVPKKLYLTRGVGVHSEKLQAFEGALRDAGIATLNLVSVSSIYPPGCRIVSRKRGENLLEHGQIAFVVLSRAESNEPHRMIASSIGVAVPRDKRMYGYLSEHHAFGQTGKEAGDYAEDLAASMLASTLGVEFDESQSWDEKRQLWKISGKIVVTRNVTQSAVVGREGRWTTVVSAAVLLFD
jgi:arginine decarboxylase